MWHALRQLQCPSLLVSKATGIDGWLDNIVYTAQPYTQISSDMFSFMPKDQIWKMSEDTEHFSQSLNNPQHKDTKKS